MGDWREEEKQIYESDDDEVYAVVETGGFETWAMVTVEKGGVTLTANAECPDVKAAKAWF